MGTEPVAIGIDLGGTAVKAGIVGINGDLLDSFQEPAPRTPPALRVFVHSVLKRAARRVCGIGIGCKGVVDAATSRVLRSPGDQQFLEGLTLAEIVEAGEIPVCADNDARTALIAQVLWGAARGRRNVVLLTLGTGVGGAALVDGVVVRGASGAAGHLGHVTVDPLGPLCMCGNTGCLETRFSARSIEAEFFAHVHRGVNSSLAAPATTEAIFRAARDGDKAARRVLERATRYLADAIAGFLHTFDPEILILAGSVAAAGPQLLEPLQGEVARRTNVLLGREVPIVCQQEATYGGVLGAAGHVFLRQGLLKI